MLKLTLVHSSHNVTGINLRKNGGEIGNASRAFKVGLMHNGTGKSSRLTNSAILLMFFPSLIKVERNREMI